MRSLLVNLCYRFSPGIVLCCLVCLIAFGLQRIGQSFFGHLFPETLVLSILLGVLCRSLIDQGWLLDFARFDEGVGFCAHFLLECAVMLVGAVIPVGILLRSGAYMMGGVAVIVFLSIILSYYLARMLRVERHLSLLLACGNAICGNSAIVAVAPVIEAKATEIAPAIAFTAVLGVVVVLLLPLAVPLFDFDDHRYGVFAGMVVYAVPQVMAATAPVSAVAMQSATLVKLMRVLMLGPLILILGFLQSRHNRRKGNAIRNVGFFVLVPWFVVGFVLLMLLRSIDIIPSTLLSWLMMAMVLLTNLAMAALGLGCDMRTLARSGGRVIGAAILSLCTLGFMSAIFCYIFI